MILWTPLPIETVIEGSDKWKPQLIRRPLPGGGAVVIDLSSGEEIIHRLESTDPQLYLSSQYAPGQPAAGIPSSGSPALARPMS